MKKQKEMPFFEGLPELEFAPKAVVEGFTCYRDAVVWCWDNRKKQGAGRKMDQALCAGYIGLHTPHMSRCVDEDSQAPMNLSPDFVMEFQKFCGWYVISQYIARTTQFTLMEEVLDERRRAA